MDYFNFNAHYVPLSKQTRDSILEFVRMIEKKRSITSESKSAAIVTTKQSARIIQLLKRHRSGHLQVKGFVCGRVSKQDYQCILWALENNLSLKHYVLERVRNVSALSNVIYTILDFEFSSISNL